MVLIHGLKQTGIRELVDKRQQPGILLGACLLGFFLCVCAYVCLCLCVSKPHLCVGLGDGQFSEPEMVVQHAIQSVSH